MLLEGKFNDFNALEISSPLFCFPNVRTDSVNIYLTRLFKQ